MADENSTNGTDKLKPEKLINLKPLTALLWPPEPDASIFTDPLKRDDPKPLRHEELLRIGMSRAAINYTLSFKTYISDFTTAPAPPHGYISPADPPHPRRHTLPARPPKLAGSYTRARPRIARQAHFRHLAITTRLAASAGGLARYASREEGGREPGLERAGVVAWASGLERGPRVDRRGGEEDHAAVCGGGVPGD